MKNFQKKSVLVLGLILVMGTVVHASPAPPSPPSAPTPATPKRAPEIDPSLAISGVALLAGSLAVLRARRD